jgi:hypothetical protein
MLVPFGQGVSGEKICLTLANQKQELLLAAMFIGRMEPNEDALYKILHRCFQHWQEASMKDIL